MKKIAKREIVLSGVFDKRSPGAGIKKPKIDITTRPTGKCWSHKNVRSFEIKEGRVIIEAIDK